jgi:glycosyltransferase involved in cell wall biosynthesis
LRIFISAISFSEYVIQQANALSLLGHAVMVFMPRPLIDATVGQTVDKLLLPSVNCNFYNVERKRFSFYRNIIRLISDFNPDVLHLHENGEPETLAILIRFRYLPLVVTVHDVTYHSGTDAERYANRFQRRALIERYSRARANLIHVHADALRKQLCSNDPILGNKGVVIPHGTLSLFKHWDNGETVREPHTCLFFGRMEKYKGLDNLIEIGMQLKTIFPRFKIIVAGKGDELNKYKLKMESTGVFEIHDFFIPDNEVYKYFRRASLLLLPYHEASQSGIIHMGISFGLPVVATAVGAIHETIVDGVHGRIIHRGDIDGFARAVAELLKDQDGTVLKRKACLALADKLEFSNLAVDFVQLYEKVAVERRGI